MAVDMRVRSAVGLLVPGGLISLSRISIMAEVKRGLFGSHK
jgi:hypothetical protein